MDEKVADSPLGDANGFCGCGFFSSEFSRNENLSHFLCGAVVHPCRVDFQQHDAVGGIEGLYGIGTTFFLFFVFQLVGGTEGDEIQGLASGMKVEHPVRHGQQGPLEIICNFLGDASFWTPGKGTIHIAGIDR